MEKRAAENRNVISLQNGISKASFQVFFFVGGFIIVKQVCSKEDQEKSWGKFRFQVRDLHIFQDTIVILKYFAKIYFVAHPLFVRFHENLRNKLIVKISAFLKKLQLQFIENRFNNNNFIVFE